MTSSGLPSPAAARRELLSILKGCALRPSQGQPLQTLEGDPTPWLFYSWDATLTYRGALLAGVCMRDILREYEASCLASVGYTGLPLLMACITHGEGRYQGLCVRDSRKEYGSMRKIEGPVCRNGPVVVIDDSLVSGISMTHAIESLEAEGFQVEGGLCLVNFPWGGGMERLNALGYRVESIFDVARDLQFDEPVTSLDYRTYLPDSWENPPIEDGLHPATVSRRVAERYLLTGSVPCPPKRFDREYDGRGGVFVSFRNRDTNARIARDGFWHFDPLEADPCRDVVLATMAVLRWIPDVAPETLRNLKIGLSFLGPFERVEPGGLDFFRYGVVVRSKAGDRIGGALPNTEFFIGEVEQYRHARAVNALIGEFEPHDIFRHTVFKAVEPGEYWLPFGSSEPSPYWVADPVIGQKLVQRARGFLKSLEGGYAPKGAPLSDDLIPVPVYSVAVTLFHRGVIGSCLSWSGTLDECLRAATECAYGEARRHPRFPDAQDGGLAIAVSILHDQEHLGEVSIEEAAGTLRRGLDSLSVEHPGGGEIILPFACVYENLPREAVADALMEKAGNPSPPLSWAIYQTAAWLERGGRTFRLRFGLPERSDSPCTKTGLKLDCEILAGYIARHLRSDGLPEHSYQPTTGESVEAGPPSRLVHALWALDKAGRLLRCDEWRRKAQRGLQFCLDHIQENGPAGPTLMLPELRSDPLADSMLLMALADAGQPYCSDRKTTALAAKIRSMVQPDGRITDMPGARGIDLDHDMLPGVALLSLARFARSSGEYSPTEGLETVLHWYARRFRLLHPWNMVGWHPQAWSTWYSITGDSEMAAFAFEICDWALQWQHEDGGMFLCDLVPEGLSFHTGFFAEAISDAGKMANMIGDAMRFDRYRQSCIRAMRFMNRLIIREEDLYCMAEPDRALGGVRGAVFLSEVRVDYVSHTLAALLNVRDLFQLN